MENFLEQGKLNLKSDEQLKSLFERLENANSDEIEGFVKVWNLTKEEYFELGRIYESSKK